MYLIAESNVMPLAMIGLSIRENFPISVDIEVHQAIFESATKPG